MTLFLRRIKGGSYLSVTRHQQAGIHWILALIGKPSPTLLHSPIASIPLYPHHNTTTSTTKILPCSTTPPKPHHTPPKPHHTPPKPHHTPYNPSPSYPSTHHNSSPSYPTTYSTIPTTYLLHLHCMPHHTCHTCLLTHIQLTLW